jgi:thiol-disulfide isomerase/thioredoxin
MKTLLALLVAVAFASAAYAAKEVDPAELVGKPLPALTGLDYFKARPDLKGKPAIVEFWATWCPPCRESIPHLNEIYKEYNSKGLQVLGITDEPSQTIRAFIKKMPIDYPVATDKRNIAADFGISGIPHAFVVDKAGNVVWEGHPMSLTKKIIEKVM